MKFLVTGGAGFIGSHLAKKLLKLDHSVRIIDDFSTGALHNLSEIQNDLEIIQADINDTTKLEKAVNKVDGVFHFASKIFTQESLENPQAYFHTNVNGTLNLIQAAIRFNVPRIVFSSSSAVYGDTPNLPVLETHQTDPLSPYGITKLTAEQCGKIYAEKHDLSFVALRYFNVYGKGQPHNSPYSGVISRFIDALKNEKPLTFYGNGEQSRDFVHVDDIVDANILSMLASEIVFEVFNCATNSSTSILELSNVLNSIFNKSPIIERLPSRTGDIFESRGDFSKIRNMINWSPKFDLSTGLIEALTNESGEILGLGTSTA